MKKVIITILALTPVFAFAQTLTNLSTLVSSIGGIVNIAIPIVFSLALLAFFWGLVKYIFAQGDETSKADGKKIMLWGLVALFVGASVWGIVQFARTNLGVPTDNTIGVPRVTP